MKYLQVLSFIKDISTNKRPPIKIYFIDFKKIEIEKQKIYDNRKKKEQKPYIFTN
jgi:hypothetical protein